MKKPIIVIVLAFCSFTISFSINPKNKLNVKEFTLSNGLTVWLNQDYSQPKVIGSIIVKAGAKDSPNTGVAHYFEHIMFKGTDKIGTVNYAEEKVWLDSISQKYDELAKLSDKNERLEVQKEINELSIKAAEYVIPNEFNRLISEYGGTGLNAGTAYDYTMYFNTFLPQYLAHWCELNSERLINPVFRMFQSELETVYEEKNMYADKMGSQAIEKILEKFFKPHPYQYPIIGSTENLKNPRLSEMEEFFRNYYVASNMGLILSGNFDADEVLPLLEKTFGRVQQGTAPKKDIAMPATIDEKIDLKVKVPIPFVRINALLWRGVPANHPDEVALQLAMSLLSNENKTGMLDKISIDGKLMMSAGLSMSMNDAGVVAIVGVPNIPFQTYGSAQKRIFEAVEKIKQGDFTDEMFQSLKLEQQRNYLLELESLDKRNQKMIDVFSKGLTWSQYLEDAEKIKTITKQDVIDVANKYLTDNYFDIKKKTGKYPSAKVDKPPFKPIEASNTEKQSDYSKWLETIDYSDAEPRFLNFEQEGKAIAIKNNPLAKLYTTPNEMNNVFNLTMKFGVGNHELPMLSSMISYLNYIGTDKYSVDEFNQKLQELGSTLNFSTTSSQFTVTVVGFDNMFEETLDLVTHFLTHVQPDKSKLKKVIKERSVEDKAIKKSPDELGKAMTEKVKYGENSKYLKRLSIKELKKISADGYIFALQKALSTEVDFHYTGSLLNKRVEELLMEYFPIAEVREKSNNPTFRDGMSYQQPKVYFFNDSKATQSIVQAYIQGPEQKSVRGKHLSQLFNTYFGSGMSSLMFQEIREFRSLAYRASSSFDNPAIQLTNKAMLFNMLLSTQADKTIDAIVVLESLLADMPLSSKRLEAAKETLVNKAQSAYPNFRKKTQQIALAQRKGYSEDPNKMLVEDLSNIQLKDLRAFYEQNIKDQPIVYIVIGNEKKIDVEQLKQMGEFEEMKLKEFLNL